MSRRSEKYQKAKAYPVRKLRPLKIQEIVSLRSKNRKVCSKKFLGRDWVSNSAKTYETIKQAAGDPPIKTDQFREDMYNFNTNKCMGLRISTPAI